MSQIEDLCIQEKEAIEELRRRTANLVTSEMYDDSLLFYRFLKARDFNIDKAELMLKKHMVWKRALQIDTILDDFKPLPAFLDYVQGTYLGEDKNGSGVRYVMWGSIDVRDIINCFKINNYIMHWAWTFEKEIAIIKEANKKAGKTCIKITSIFDLDKLQFTSAAHPQTPQYFIRGIQMLQDNYPETLKAIYLINAPSYYVLVYAVAKQFLASEVVKKVHVFGRNGWKEELLKVIDADVLPAFLGGTRTDPDGNPLCKTFVNQGGKIPSKYYLTKEERTFKNQSQVKHISVSPRTRHDICLEVPLPGSTIQWVYETKKKDIGFGLFFKESEETLKEILPIYRYETRDGTETGSFKCQLTGTYVLVFDNTFSSMTTKEVSYCFTVLSPQ